MISRSRRFQQFLFVALLAFLLPTAMVLAQSTNRQIGTQLEVMADPLVPRPHGHPCVVPLFANYQFAHFSQSTQTFDFTPPGNCAGPWEKVVLEADFSENGGVQVDRTASIYLANTNIYFGTMMMNASFSVRPRMNASGATSITFRSSSLSTFS